MGTNATIPLQAPVNVDQKLSTTLTERYAAIIKIVPTSLKLKMCLVMARDKVQMNHVTVSAFNRLVESSYLVMMDNSVWMPHP